MEKNEYTDENTIVELDIDETKEFEETENIAKVDEDEIVIDLKKEEKTKKKKNKKPKTHKKLSKKGKIIIFVSAGVLLLIIAGLLLYFLVFNKHEDKKPKEEDVVLEEDNYRYENGVLKFIGDKKDDIGTYKCKDKDEKKCYVAFLSNEDEFDLPIYEHDDGKRIEKRSKIYNNNFVFIFDDSKIFLYDIKKETSIGEYKLVKTGDIDANLVVLKDEHDKYGLLSIEGNKAETILDFDYEYLGIFNSTETFVAKDGTSSYLIGLDGKPVSKNIRGEIKSFNDNFIAVKNEDYELYSYEGEKALNDSFDYIDFNNNYVFVMKGVKLFAYDASLYKLNEVAIKLKTSTYGKTYVFDKDNNLKETKKPYTVTITNDSISFELNETTTKKINLYEAENNKAYAYINYYDGTLYIYEDTEKTTLLGSYDCANKNTVTDGTSGYSNCIIANDSKIINKTTGIIPIINNNYVFIKDIKTGASTNTIVLYDMSKSKVLSKYQEVDTGVGNEDISHVTMQNNVVYGKNSEGYYGAITFSPDGPKGLIQFREDNGTGTTKMQLLGDNILVKRGDMNYLYDKLGNKLASSTFEIVKYEDGKVLVKNGNKYLIYTMPNGNSGNIISEELDYIDMYDKYFIGIKDKKLNVYYYTNGKDKLLTEDIEVKNNTKDSYKLEKFSDSYVIHVIAGEDATVDYKFDKNWGKIENEE